MVTVVLNNNCGIKRMPRVGERQLWRQQPGLDLRHGLYGFFHNEKWKEVLNAIKC